MTLTYYEVRCGTTMLIKSYEDDARMTAAGLAKTHVMCSSIRKVTSEYLTGYGMDGEEEP